MFKTLFLFVILFFIAGCSLKQTTNEPPLWYSHPPKDYQFIYSTASSKTLQSAHNIAVLSMNRDLYVQMSDAFKSKDSAFVTDNSLELKSLTDICAKVANSIIFHGVKTVNSAEFNSEYLILISVARSEIFEEQKKKLDELYEPIKDTLTTIDSLSAVKQYAALSLITNSIDEIAARTQLLAIVSNGFDASEYFSFANNVKKRYKELQKTTAIRVLGDFNSIRFVHYFQEAITQQGLLVDKALDKKENYNVYVVTEVEKKMDYQFYKTTLRVKTIIASKAKEIIATKVHTFIGKSRKGYQDAQAQAETDVGKQIKFEGIFSFLGLETNKPLL